MHNCSSLPPCSFRQHAQLVEQIRVECLSLSHVPKLSVVSYESYTSHVPHNDVGDDIQAYILRFLVSGSVLCSRKASGL